MLLLMQLLIYSRIENCLQDQHRQKEAVVMVVADAIFYSEASQIEMRCGDEDAHDK